MSPIVEVCDNTFNTGESKYAAQFNQSKVNIARYLQRQYPDKGYGVSQTVWTGQVQTIPLPPALTVVVAPDVHDPDKVLLRGVVVKLVGKQRIQLEKDLKRAYAVVYEQCLQDVKDKLGTTTGWEAVEANQWLHKVISKVERICVGFDNHKQETFNLVQSLKALYLYS